MAVLKVLRPTPGKRSLLIEGRLLPVGTEIETGDFPRISKIPERWGQLIDQGYLEDNHLTDPDIVREAQQRRERFGPARPVDTRPEPTFNVGRFMDAEDHARLEKPTALQCGECGYQATSDQGLKVHTGRIHKKE